MTIELLKPVRVLNSANCWPAKPPGARRGILLHFDDSSNDTSAVEWFSDPTCHVSYNRLYLDDGRVVQITPTMEHAAWHAGACSTANANRVYYGLAIAANPKTPATTKQFEAIAHDCAALVALNHWSPADVTKLIVGHEDEAVWTKKEKPKNPELWGTLGRKIDPTIPPHGPVILSTMQVRHRVLELLGVLAT